MSQLEDDNYSEPEQFGYKLAYLCALVNRVFSNSQNKVIKYPIFEYNHIIAPFFNQIKISAFPMASN